MKKNALILKLVGVILEANERGACIWFEVKGHVSQIEVRMSESKIKYKQNIQFSHSNTYGWYNTYIDDDLSEDNEKAIKDIIDFIYFKYL